MEQSPLISVGLPLALFVIMTGMGLTLTVDDFRREARQPRATLVGLLLALVAMPAVGFGLAAALGLAPMLAVGVVVLATCPGGTTSNLVTFLARGNVALSIVLTVAASLVTILTLPLATGLAMSQFADAGEAVRLPLGQTVGMLVGIVLVPVLIGMTVRARRPDWARRAERGVSLFGAAVLALLILAIAYSLRDRLVELLVQAGPACVLLGAAGVALGLGVGRAAGLGARDALTAAVELGVKNGTLGLLVTLSVLESAEASVPSAIYGLLMYGFALALIAFGKRTLPASASGGPALPARA